MAHRLDLLFLPPLKEHLIGPPIALIYITRRFFPIKEKYAKGRIFITSRCDSIEELEAEIDLIKRDLEIIRKKAKQKFTKGHKS